MSIILSVKLEFCRWTPLEKCLGCVDELSLAVRYRGWARHIGETVRHREHGVLQHDWLPRPLFVAFGFLVLPTRHNVDVVDRFGRGVEDVHLFGCLGDGHTLVVDQVDDLPSLVVADDDVLFAHLE